MQVNDVMHTSMIKYSKNKLIKLFKNKVGRIQPHTEFRKSVNKLVYQHNYYSLEANSCLY